MQKGNVPRLLAAIVGCEAIGIIGGLYTRDGVEQWYPKLKKPAFNPPGWIFGPVWTLLYALMGAALYLAARDGDPDRDATRLGKFFFGLQLALNGLWSFIFFRRRSPLYALVEIAFLWLAILLTVLAFARVSRRAALLLLPYLLWVSFAALLNFEIWRLNRQ